MKMTKTTKTTTKKIELATTRDIPFNKLILSQANVRTLKTGVSIDELAADIARRGLLQSLCVRPVIGADGKETGMYEVPAGGRRYRALEKLVNDKRLAKTAPVPCIVREDGLAEEDSLAENTQREALHPVDQFRAFQTLIDKNLTEEEVAARFFVPVQVVKQRLRLAAVSEKLLEAYIADEMTLEQLMAFTVTHDRARQEQVWEQIRESYNDEPYYIRRVLTEGAVSGTDRRAVFVGIEAYAAAGGTLVRDLFEKDNGGWLEDAALLDRLASEKLKAEAETLAGEGWKWIAAAIDFPYGHKQGLRRLVGETIDMSAEEQTTRAALGEEYDRLQAEYEDAEELPDEVDARLGELEHMMEALDDRPVKYDPADVAVAGAFISLDHDGRVLIERGYVRPEDEAPAAPPQKEASASGGTAGSAAFEKHVTVITVGGDADDAGDEIDDGALRPLSDKLVMELTAQKTVALGVELSRQPDMALRAVVHALTLTTLYQFAADESCLQVRVMLPPLRSSVPDPDGTPGMADRDRDRADWDHRLPERPEALWPWCLSQPKETLEQLLAFVAGHLVDGMRRAHERADHRRLRHADALARAVNLDMAAAGWKPTDGNYLGRVPKARILEAVREGKGEGPAQLIDHLKKGEMVKEAQRLLGDTSWLPEPLRIPVEDAVAADEPAADLPDFLADEDEKVADGETAEEDELAAAE
jgi:ParB family chromosome partitioning protein